MFVATPMQFLAIACASNNKRDRVALFINNLTHACTNEAAVLYSCYILNAWLVWLR